MHHRIRNKTDVQANKEETLMKKKKKIKGSLFYISVIVNPNQSSTRKRLLSNVIQELLEKFHMFCLQRDGN